MTGEIPSQSSGQALRAVYPERSEWAQDDSRLAWDDHAGFTLVEVVVVLAILGTVAAITAPSLLQLARKDDVTGAANLVAGVLRNARMVALERAAPVLAVIEPAAGKYLVSAESDDAPVTLAQGTLQLPPSVQLRSEAPRVRFPFSATGSGESDSITVTGDLGTAVVGVDSWGGVFVRTGGGSEGRRVGEADRRTGGREK